MHLSRISCRHLAGCLIFLLLVSSARSAGDKSAKEKERKRERAAAKLAPCQACNVLSASFERGMEKTSRGKLEGGDAAWEEKNQGSGYSKSEVRFVEIQESLCKDVERGETQCHDNHHHWEERLEEWWALEDEQRKPLKEWLCIDTLKVRAIKHHN